MLTWWFLGHFVGSKRQVHAVRPVVNCDRRKAAGVKPRVIWMRLPSLIRVLFYVFLLRRFVYLISTASPSWFIYNQQRAAGSIPLTLNGHRLPSIGDWGRTDSVSTLVSFFCVDVVVSDNKDVVLLISTVMHTEGGGACSYANLLFSLGFPVTLFVTHLRYGYGWLRLNKAASIRQCLYG